jgi:rod shape-determining protein MreC
MTNGHEHVKTVVWKISFKNKSLSDGSGHWRTWRYRLTFPLLLLLSVLMIAVGKTDQMVLAALRISVMDAAAPILEMLSRPLSLLDSALGKGSDFLTAYRENARLEKENVRLLDWQQAALRLASENAQLRELLKLAPEPASSYVTARVIANSGGAYVRSIVVNAGRENGVTRGQAAITGDGLIGRVTEVGSRAARVLLITDLNSRVPVTIEGSRLRAVLTGDNSERPSLHYAEAGSALRIGDRIVTLGQGGVFPPGLPVGIVAGFDGELPRVEPYAELSRVDYLRLVDYGLGDVLPNPPLLIPRNGKRSDQALGQTIPR